MLNPICNPKTGELAPIEHRYILYRWLYSIAADDIEMPLDFEYAAIERECITKKLVPEYTGRTWSDDPCPKELLQVYGLERYVREITLNGMSCSIKSVTDELEVRQTYTTSKCRLLAFKMDGWNVHLGYISGHLMSVRSRGRDKDALDFNHIRNIFPQYIPEKEEVRIELEILVSDTNFKRLKEKFPEKNLRSQRLAVSCALANAPELLTYRAYVVKISGKTFIPVCDQYNMLTKWGFRVPHYKIINGGAEEILKTCREFSELIEDYGEMTDGMVVRDNDSTFQRAIRLYGWTEKIYATYIEDYDVDQGGTANYSWRLKIKPVITENSTVDTLPAVNLRRVYDYNWRKGQPIVFRMVSYSVPIPDWRLTRDMQEKWYLEEETYRDRIDMYERIKSENLDKIKEIIAQYGLYV